MNFPIRRMNHILHLKNLTKIKTGAIIVAAGKGTRMEATCPKQFLKLQGIPVYIHTLRAFDSCKNICSYVLVTNEEFIHDVEEELQFYKIKKCICVCAGGKTRQESVEQGLKHLPEDLDYIAIHDGARCLITPEQIKEVCLAAWAYQAACPGRSITGTVKEVNRDYFIESTIPREEIFEVSTPQIFKKEYYYLALTFAKKKNAIVTDDTSLMEYINQRVKIVDIGHQNIKITYKEDLLLADFILQERKKKRKK